MVLAGVGIPSAVFASEALSVRDDLTNAKEELAKIPDLIKSGDSSSLESVAAEATSLAAHADNTVQGPLWGVAAKVPLVGSNITAVKLATEATNILVRDALPVGVQLMTTLQPANLKVEGGGFNLEPFEGVQESLPTINAAFAEAKTKIDSIDTESLHPAVETTLGSLVDIVDEAAPLLQGVERALPTALKVLGKDEPRKYLLLFQNNAELRATGGNPAATSVMGVDNGKIELLDQADSGDFYDLGLSGNSFAEVPAETQALYEDDFTIYSQNYTRTPNFPTTAALFKGLWEAASSDPIDGVISIDPIVLANLLTVTGPVALEDGSELNSDNAVKVLLFDAYERMSGPEADVFFADVASRVFDKLSSGEWDPLAMIDALGKSTDQQRLYIWMEREDEQAKFQELGLSGLMTSDNVETTQVGVFLNNAEYSKLDYFFSQDVAVTCDAAAGTMTTTLTMNSTVPGPNLNNYTLGWRNERLGLPRTTMILDVLYFAPPGSEIVGSDPGEGNMGSGWDRSGAENGRNVKSMTFTLPMGQTKEVSFTSTIPEGATSPVSVRYTPTVTDTPVTIGETCPAVPKE